MGLSNTFALPQRDDQFSRAHGQPFGWICPDCGCFFTIFPGLEFGHNCGRVFRTAPKTCWCYFRLLDDHRVESLVVAEMTDANTTVESIAPDGTIQFWTHRIEGGLDVFYPPKNYRDGEFYGNERGVVMKYDGTLQRHEFVTRLEQERQALHNRKTVDMRV